MTRYKSWPTFLKNKPEYNNREQKEKAYSELAEHFPSTSSNIKIKSEIGKESRTKNGQAASGKYIIKQMLYVLA